MSKVTSLDANSAAMLTQQNTAVSKAENIGKRGLNSEKEIDKATSGFEALLLHQMLSAMWSTVESTNMFGEDSNQSQIYRDMLNQSIADSVAGGRGIGVKEFLRKELERKHLASKDKGNIA